MKQFKNDKERIAFLEERREEDGWYLWGENGATNTRYWRYDLPDCALIYLEEMRTFSYPKQHITWTPVHWYIVKDWSRPFGDSVASRSLALAEIKRVEKEAKGK